MSAATRLHVGVALDFAPVSGETYAERLAALQPVIDAIDTLGLRSISAGESYPARRDDPMGFHSPNALMILAAIASRTHVSQLVAGVLLLGAWPIDRLVRDVGLTDQLCSGRLVLGLGLGPLQLWDNRRVARTDIGSTVDSTIIELRHRLADQSGPGPVNHAMPIWIGGSLRRSAERAAELGDGYTVSTGYPSGLISERVSQYWARRGPASGAVSINRACVLAGTKEEAGRRSGAGVTPLLRAYAQAGAIAGADGATGDQALADDVALVGTPDQVARQVNGYIAAGVTHLQLRVAPGATDMTAAIETLELFVNDVAPQLIDIPDMSACRSKETTV